MRIAILLVAISVSATSVQYKQAMQDLNQSHFGNTLLETIQMHLQTAEPIGNLVQMLQNLDQQITKVQEKADASYARTKGKCDADLAKLNDAISVLQVKQVTLKSDIDTLNPQVRSAVATVERKTKEIQELKKELQDSAEQRARENAQYKQILDDLEGSLFGFENVKTTINRFIDGVQKGNAKFEQFIEVQKSIKQIRHTIKLEGYKYFIQILSQLGFENNEDALKLAKQLTSIVKQIQSYIQTERIREDTAEQSREVEFQNFRELIAGQAVDASNDLTEMTGILESLSSRLKQSQLEKQEVDVKLQNKLKEFEDQQTECKLNDQEYETQTNGRNNQHNLLDQAILLTTTSLGQLKSDLLKHAGQE